MKFIWYFTEFSTNLHDFGSLKEFLEYLND
jgi:hypothetical protein